METVKMSFHSPTRPGTQTEAPGSLGNGVRGFWFSHVHYRPTSPLLFLELQQVVMARVNSPKAGATCHCLFSGTPTKPAPSPQG